MTKPYTSSQVVAALLGMQVGKAAFYIRNMLAYWTKQAVLLRSCPDA